MMLMPNEVVSIQTRKHWITWVGGPLWWFVYYITFGIALIIRLIIWYFSKFAVTNQRIYLSAGLITKTTRECPLSQIQNISYKQGLFGQIFGYGDVIVQSTVGIYHFDRVPNPEHVRNAVAWLIQAAREQQALYQAQLIGQQVALGLGGTQPYRPEN